MTTSLIIACAISWTAAIAAVIAAAMSWRAQQQARAVLIAVRAERRTFTWRGGEVTVTAPMSDADYETFRASFTGVTTRPGDVCEAYRPPAASEDSGLCARCGMSDYKHQEQPDA